MRFVTGCLIFWLFTAATVAAYPICSSCESKIALQIQHGRTIQNLLGGIDQWQREKDAYENMYHRASTWMLENIDRENTAEFSYVETTASYYALAMATRVEWIVSAEVIIASLRALDAQLERDIQACRC